MLGAINLLNMKSKRIFLSLTGYQSLVQEESIIGMFFVTVMAPTKNYTHTQL